MQRETTTTATMSANLQSFRSALTRLGFPNAARLAMPGEDRENVTVDILADLNDDTIGGICNTIMSPGGLIDNPAALDANGLVIPSVPVQIRNPGAYVPGRAEESMKVACYMARHYVRTGRTLTSQHITMVHINRFKTYRATEKENKDPDELTELAKPEKVQDFIDEFPGHLFQYDGQDGRPLSYVIRNTVAVPDENTDPMFGEADCIYPSVRDEINARDARAAHGDAQFQIDNARLFDKLKEAVLQYKTVYAWIKPFSREKDGQGAWLTFKAHYLGSSQLDTMANKAESRIENAAYHGEQPHYSFETHISIHQQAHKQINLATGTTWTAREMVRKLLLSIQAKNMMVAVATVKANPALRGSWEETVNFLRDFVGPVPSEQRNISELSAEHRYSQGGWGDRGGRGGRGGRHGGRGDRAVGTERPKVEDRYYKRSEWIKLDTDEQQEIRDLHEGRQDGEKHKAATVEVEPKEPEWGTMTHKAGTPTSRSRNGSKTEMEETRHASGGSLNSSQAERGPTQRTPEPSWTVMPTRRASEGIP
jgi:hypothetical protein